MGENGFSETHLLIAPKSRQNPSLFPETNPAESTPPKEDFKTGTI
jgi:hypothetical protein